MSVSVDIRTCFLVLVFAASGPSTSLAQLPPDLPGAARAGVAPGETFPPDTLPSLPVEILKVPPVYDRPLAAEEGPRVLVERFTVSDRGIAAPNLDRDALNSAVEAMRQRLQGIDRQNPQGFTDEEMTAIVELFRAITGRAADEIRLAENRVLAQRIRDAIIARRGMTIGQLQLVANEVTRHYRSAGYFLATAVVPAQTVVDGEVAIYVLPGKLGAVSVEGNRLYGNERLQAPFADLVGRPVAKEEIESALFTLSDYPGLAAYGVFQRGEEVGATDLVINVDGERVQDWLLRLDNHGAETTGEYRLRLDYARNNPGGRADRLDATLLASARPHNTLFGRIEYRSPVLRPELQLGGGLDHNSFDVGARFADFGISGVSTVARVFLRRQLWRGRNRNAYGSLELAAKRAETRIGGQTISEDRLSVLELEFGFDAIDTRFAGVNQVTARLSRGLPSFLGALAADGDPESSRQGGSFANAGGEFTKLNLTLGRLQRISADQTLLLRVDAQFSDDLLVALEQSVLGGPNSVRGYGVAEFLRDRSLLLSVDWSHRAPGFAERPAFRGLTWGEVLQTSVFFDYAQGEINDPAPGDVQRVHLASAGLAARLSVTEQLSARLQAAWPLSDRDPENDRRPQYWFDLRYAF